MGAFCRMSFASKIFLFSFLPIFLICYFGLKGIRARNLVFIVFSLVFYSAIKPVFLLILIASVGANFRLAIAIDQAVDHRRYRLLGYGAAANLLVLGIFKYTGFAVENLNAVLSLADISLPVPKMGLPLGISFYTFHAISYIADVAKRRVEANRRFGEFMLTCPCSHNSYPDRSCATPQSPGSCASGAIHSAGFPPECASLSSVSPGRYCSPTRLRRSPTVCSIRFRRPVCLKHGSGCSLMPWRSTSISVAIP